MLSGDMTQPWSPNESSLFFDGLVKHGRIWGLVAENVKSRTPLQVQMYYNTLLQHINESLDLPSCDMNLQDVVDQMITVLSFWTLTCDRMDSLQSPDFVNELRDMIVFQKNRISNLKRIIVRLVPRTNELMNRMRVFGINPLMQLTVSPHRPLYQVIQIVGSKWSEINIGGSLKLFPPAGISRVHNGWSEDDTEVTVDTIFRQLQFPDPFTLEYDYEPEVPPIYAAQPPASETTPQIAHILSSLDTKPKESVETRPQTAPMGERQIPENTASDVEARPVAAVIATEKDNNKKRQRNTIEGDKDSEESDDSDSDSENDEESPSKALQNAKKRHVDTQDSNSGSQYTFFDSLFKVEFNRRFVAGEKSRDGVPDPEIQKLYQFDDDSRPPGANPNAPKLDSALATAKETIYDDSLGFTTLRSATEKSNLHLFNTSSIVTQGSDQAIDQENEDIRGFVEKTGFVPFRSLKQNFSK